MPEELLLVPELVSEELLVPDCELRGTEFVLELLLFVFAL